MDKNASYYSLLHYDKNILKNIIADDNPNKSNDNQYIDSFDLMQNRIYKQPHLNGYFFIFMTRPSLNLVISDSKMSPSYIERSRSRLGLDLKHDPTIYTHDEMIKFKEATGVLDPASNIARSPIISQIFNRNKDLVECLSRKSRSPFLKLITNFSLGLDLKDTTLKTGELLETIMGYKMRIPFHNIESTSAGEFSIPYYNDDNLLIFNLHQVWLDYINGVKLGKYDPDPDPLEYSYLDYMSSVYYFLLKPDLETLVWWGKYTGVFPDNIPHSIFGSKRFNIDTVDEISISYQYSYKEEMDLDILNDFSLVAKDSLGMNSSDLFTEKFGESIKFNYPLFSLKKYGVILEDSNMKHLADGTKILDEKDATIRNSNQSSQNVDRSFLDSIKKPSNSSNSGAQFNKYSKASRSQFGNFKSLNNFSSLDSFY